LNVTKRNFNVTVKLSRNYDSVAFSEGLEFELNDEENKAVIEEEFEDEKRRLSQKVYSEAKTFISGLQVEKARGTEVIKNGKLDVDIKKIDLSFKKANELEE